MEKPLPPATFRNLFPPNNGFDFFVGAQSHPFRFGTTKFELVNAWWLAESSLLAYSDDDFAADCFARAGLAGLRAFHGATTDCFVAHNDEFAIVAFRGTEVGDYRDFITDLKIRLVASGGAGRVHQGFRDALDEVWETKKLRLHLEALRNSGTAPRAIWFAGHSLGAALATLAAARLEGTQGLYTFGSPRVGDAEFSARFAVKAYRVVNNNDFIPRLPPSPPYDHVGRLKYIDSEGRLHRRTSRLHRLKDNLAGHVTHLANVARRFRSGMFGEVLDDNLADHAPIYYAIHLWNNYVRA